MRLRARIADWVPPVIARAVARLENVAGRGNRWTGDHQSWEAALAGSGGYDDASVVASVAAATARVVAGQAAFERDSVTFAEAEYVWPVLASLLWVAARRGGRLDLVDFGGALGSLYHQHRRFLDRLTEVHWSVVEQAGFVAVGRERFQDERLRFFATLDECPAADTVLLSSVLQYLPEPYALVDRLVAGGWRWVIVDRTSFHAGAGDRLVVQHVPRSVYAASYPCWFLDEDRVKAAFGRAFDLVAEIPDSDRALAPCRFKGLLFERR